MPDAFPVWTIGHSDQPLQRLLGLLRELRVKLVADVRSQPWSRHVPQFNREGLEQALARQGIEYRWLGEELGGRRRPPMTFGRIAALPDFRRAALELAGLCRGHRVALLCGEEDPAECHRRLLVGRALERLGGRLYHVRADGRVQTEPELQFELDQAQESFDFEQETREEK
ncbi:DUF488 domain-containing protein [candidate division WOR-3 bacterium]|nr:DUF488 domain-containing protein [candidate division WOR-3 bacterium]